MLPCHIKTKPWLKITWIILVHVEELHTVLNVEQYHDMLLETVVDNYSDMSRHVCTIALCIEEINAHPHIADGHEVRRFQIWSGLECQVPVEPILPHAGMQRTQQLGLMEENYTPTAPHLRPFHALPTSYLEWSLLGLLEAERRITF